MNTRAIREFTRARIKYLQSRSLVAGYVTTN